MDNGIIAWPLMRCDGVMGKRLLSSGFFYVTPNGLGLLAASQSVNIVYSSDSVNNLPLKILYTGYLIVCTTLSITPLCAGDRFVL